MRENCSRFHEKQEKQKIKIRIFKSSLDSFLQLPKQTFYNRKLFL